MRYVDIQCILYLDTNYNVFFRNFDEIISSFADDVDSPLFSDASSGLYEEENLKVRIYGVLSPMGPAITQLSLICSIVLIQLLMYALHI